MTGPPPSRSVDLSAIRSIPNLLRDEDEDDGDIEELDLNGDCLSVPMLVQLLRSPSAEEREEALASLAELVDAAFGEDGARLGMEVRAVGGLPILAWLLADPDVYAQQTSLMILGNLCSDSVDPHSKATKEALLPHARSVLSCVYTDDPGLRELRAKQPRTTPRACLPASAVIRWVCEC